MRKYARAEVVDVRGSSSGKIREASISKFADYEDYRTDDDYLYVRVRAISSRVNKNHDGWPSDELAKSYRTFIGKPIFVDHHNHDPSKARGVIVDAQLHVEDDLQKASALDPYYASAPANHKPPTWVELLLEVDAKSFPKLAKSIINEDIDSVSMGANVEKSVCSHCANVARHPDEYCKHVVSKGAFHDFVDDHGRKTSKKSYEDCYDIGFFEISFVFDPADETALVRDIKQAKVAAAVHAEAGERPDYDPNSLVDHMVIRARREFKQALHEGGDRPAALRAALTALREIGADRQQAVAAVQKAVATPAQMVATDLSSHDFEEEEWPDCACNEPWESCEKCGGHGNKKSHKTADRHNPPPQDDALTAPDRVNTLRQDQLCPICSSDMEDGVCSVCNYEEPPEGFDNPDLTKAQEVDQQIEQQQAELAQQETAVPQGMPAGDPTQTPPPTVASVKGTLSDNGDGTFTFVASNTTTTLSSLTVNDEKDGVLRLANAGAGGKVNTAEKPVLPVSRQTTDKATNVRVEKDYSRPVESSTKGVQMGDQTQKIADGATPHGGADTKPDKRVDVTDVGGVLPAGEADHQSVEKEVHVEGDPTDTWNGTKRQHDPVTDKPSQGKDAYASEQHEAREILNEDHAVEIDVTKPLTADGIVGERTKTFDNPSKRTTNPVTNEESNGTPDIGTNLSEVRSSVKAHVLAALKLAEQEVEMGLTAPEDKFNRADELEQKSTETLHELGQQLARTKKAGLTRTANTKKSASAPGSLPSMRVASVAEHVGSVDPDAEDASGLFM